MSTDHAREGQQLIDAVYKGKIDRRTFLRRAALLGIPLTTMQAVLSACSSSTSSPGQPTTAPAAKGPEPTMAAGAPATATPAVQVAKPSGKQVKVQFMHVFQPGQPAGDTMLKLLDQFNKSQQEVFVENAPVPSAGLAEKLTAQLASGAPPDLVWGGTNVKAIEEDLVVAVEDYFKGGQAFDINRFDKSWLDLLRYKGKLWAMPFELSSVSVGVNKDMFEKASIPLPKYDWKWDEMLDVAKKLVKPGDQWGWGNTRPVWQWNDAIKGAGGQLYTTGKPARSALDSPETIQGFSTYSDLWTKHKVTSVDAPVDEFNRTGKFALWPTCVAVPGYGSTLPFKYSATTYPIIKNKASLWCYKVLTMYKTTAERQEATFKFMQWFYQDDNFLEWALGGGYLPITKAQQDNPKWKDRMKSDPGWEAPMYQVQNGYLFVTPIIPSVDGDYTPMQNAADAMVLGKATPEDALKEAAKQVNTLIEQGKCLGCE